METLFVVKAAAAAVALLAATAAAGSYIAAPPLPSGFLSSPWFAANFIVVALWLLASFRRNTSTAASSDHTDVFAALRAFYPPSEHDALAAMVPSRYHVLGSDEHVSKKQTKEPRTAKNADRPRVRKKSGAEMPITDAAAEVKPDDGGGGGDGDDDVSLDSMWQALTRRGAARPVAVPKSETWGNDELPRLERAAEKAVARKEIRKSATTKEASSATAPPAAARGWRTYDALEMAKDELLRRADSLIRRHHEHLRLQRQESEQRQALKLQLHRRGRSHVTL